jgi:hypothetical protein
MKEPLHHDKLFGKVWEELFDKKGAVVPRIEHSEKLKSLLVAAQKDGSTCVELPATPQPLAAVLECFAFAKQRFDSTTDPCAKAALMALPVATVLAFTASDMRVKPHLRKSARESLEFMTSKNVRGLSLSADWGIVWEAFLRLFDAGDHDIAESSEEIEGLIAVIQRLFVEGAVFQDRVWQGPVAQQPAIGGKMLPQIISHNLKAAGLDGQFINTIVKKQLQHKYAFNVDGDPVVMWGALRPSDEAELVSRMENVAKVGIQRLHGDFPKTEMRFFLRAFNMRLVQDAFKPQGRQSEQEALTRCCEAALNAMRCPESDQAAALLEYQALATLMVGLAKPGQPLATKTNREIWGHCLDDSFLREHLPDKSFTHIPNVIRYYLIILDGSCGVERGHAQIRQCIQEHSSRDIGVLDDLAVMMDADLQPEDFAKMVCGSWEAGAFGLECAELWRQVLGARMGIYGKHPPNKEAKPGTYKSVKAGVLKAIGAATVSRRVGQPLAAQGPPSLATALAAQYGNGAASTAGTQRCPFWHKGFSCLVLVLPCSSWKLHFGGFGWELHVPFVVS